MPFTFSHPAIILPLGKIFKNYVSLTGLIVGSLAPDFEYFLRLKIKSEYSHTLIGNIWFNLPLSIIICFIFHNIIKSSLINNSPIFIQKRLGDLKELKWTEYFKKQWLIISLSILIGGYSHILWDAFTHHNAYFVNLLNLDRDIFENIKLTKILQHLSSLIGGCIIVLYFLSIKPNNSELVEPKINYWIKVVSLSVLLLTVRFLYGLKITEYGNIIVSFITTTIISLILISLIEKRNERTI